MSQNAGPCVSGFHPIFEKSGLIPKNSLIIKGQSDKTKIQLEAAN